MAKATEKNVIESVIGIDTDREIIHFYSMQNGKTESINYLMSGYKAKPFSPEFYEKIGSILGQYREDHPDHFMQKVSVVLSDSVVLTDTVNLPIINKKAMDTSLAASLSNLYGNSSDLRFNRALALQSKNVATYAVAAMRKDILHNINKACAINQIGIGNVTYASAAVTNAAVTLNSKVKNENFVILDIKEEYARIIFVVKGKTLGFYTLPFGYKILYKTRVTPEDLLFEHSTAELIVLNAKEKAKAKNLSAEEEEAQVVVEAEEPADNDEEDDFEFFAPQKRKDEEEDDDDFEDEVVEDEPESEFITRKNKKSQRKLPKFMQRPTPTNREGYMYENFRLFIKWTLEVIASNPSITALGAPETVYVNMPEEYNFLYDIVNLEAEDNGVRFAPLFTEAVDDIVKKNLELYGGFFTKQLNGFNNFTPGGYVEAPKARPTEAKAADTSSASSGGENKIGDFVKKAVEVIKKVATYDLTGGKK